MINVGRDNRTPAATSSRTNSAVIFSGRRAPSSFPDAGGVKLRYGCARGPFLADGDEFHFRCDDALAGVVSCVTRRPALARFGVNTPLKRARRGHHLPAAL